MTMPYVNAGGKIRLESTESTYELYYSTVLLYHSSEDLLRSLEQIVYI